MNSDECSCYLVNPTDPTAPPKCFTFDGVYDENSTTEQIYNEIAYSLIEGVLDGYNGTIFAYGQTGCGKSFSMQGVQDPLSQRGIIPRSFEHIFEAISLAEDYKYLILASYLEIYNEEIRDLLSSDTKKKLDLKECPDRGVYVNDLTYHPVHDVRECQRLMEQGWRSRAVGATLMNADSSRSHSIFTISVEMLPVSDLLESTSIRRGKLNLVDLAGSERQAKTGATGDRLKEATKINLSLSALGNVISALVDGKAKHIPYRDSKLTRLLQDSLGGNTKTLMVACLSPADNNYDETLSTLRYANRAKSICNKPRINEDPKDTMLREYQEEILRLRQLLENAQLDVSSDESHFNDIYDDHDVNNNNNIDTVEAKKGDLQAEYDKKLELLQKQFEDEHKSKCQVEADLFSLKKQYEEEVGKLNEQIQHVPKSESDEATKREKSVANSVQQEIIKRLNKLQASMVGGERVNDQELREKRLKKKREAERRLNMLAQIVSKVDDVEGPLVLKVYDDIQEELKVKTDFLRKYKQKVKAMDREICDLQTEFERERTDYLETIRKQERQIKLLNQILEVVMPALSKECNYYNNLDKIKEESKWNEDSQCWQLPEFNSSIKLPPATGLKNRKFEYAFTAPGKLENRVERSLCDSRQYSSCENLNEEYRFPLERLPRYDVENFAGNYFKPRRATELLLQAREETTKAVAKWKDSLQQTNVKSLAHNSSILNSNIGGSGSMKSKSQVNAQNFETGNRLSRTWTGQTSPITWMTGNVKMSPEMLPKRNSGRINLLPLIQEKKPSKTLLDPI